ncbi:TPA: YnfU family zinc-binding protein [Raoultella ornithinolytica]
MSFFDNAVKRLSSTSDTTVTYPQCGHKSRQPVNKIKKGATLMCPRCKSLFIATK